MDWAGITLSALVSFLLLLIEHYFPWPMLLGKELPLLWRYVLGVCAFLFPLSTLFLYWGQLDVVIAFWITVAASGTAVIGAYWVDGKLEQLRSLHEKVERLEEQDG